MTPQPSSQFRFFCLGTVALCAEGGVPLSGPTVQRRRLALLAVLAHAAGAPVTRDRLIGLLWPDGSDARSRAALAAALYALRRALGNQAITAYGDAVRL